MPNVRTNQRSFSGGVVTPELFGRFDDPKFQAGAATMRNFIALPHGPAANRPGFRFVRETKLFNSRVRLIPFTFSPTQTFVIEVGAGYFRFHTDGATVMDGAAPYELAHTYAEDSLLDIHYVQSGDVLTLVHPSHPPRELRRLGTANWQLTSVSFSPNITGPGGVAVVATLAPGGLERPQTYEYAATSIGSDNQESFVVSSASCSNNLLQTGAYNTVTWSAVAGAVRYAVYKKTNGLWCYIGTASGTTFTDDNITADVSRTAPEPSDPFNGAGNYPAAVSYFEQRRCFAGTTNSPQNLWMTRSGSESNMSFSLPTRDDDAINVRVAATQLNAVRHLVPLQNLVLLTNAGEWRVTSVNTDAITPTSISVKPQSYVGANNVQPLVVNNSILYPAARGGHVRELAYSVQAQGYMTGDISLRAPHLFDGFTLQDAAYQKAPQPTCWFVSSSGKLLGLTYVPEQQIGAWHEHDTDGLFESVAVVAEGEEDALYAVVRRTIGGVQRRYIERMSSRQFTTLADAFFVDSGLSYSGPPVSTVSGLGHLEGKVVSILADGAVHPRRTVVSGAITLDAPASKIHVGLPITADLATLPLALQMDSGFAQGRVKNVNKAWVRVYRSSGIFVGPDTAHLTEAKQRTNEPYGVAPALQSDEIEVMVPPSWGDGAQVVLRQVYPLPLSVLSLSMEVSVGG